MVHSGSNNKYYNKYNNYNSRIKERKKYIYIQIDGYNVSSYTVCTHYITMSVSPYTICVYQIPPVFPYTRSIETTSIAECLDIYIL